MRSMERPSNNRRPAPANTKPRPARLAHSSANNPFEPPSFTRTNIQFPSARRPLLPMPKKKSATRDHIQYHKDGTVWARGPMLRGQPTGYWEWFRKDGTKLRSGHFARGIQTGEWTTYDKRGAIYKVTVIKPQTKSRKS